jgi:flagellar motor switch protein FliM
MVNAPSAELAPERRQRPRSSANHAAALGGSGKLNPFGDLHTLQHLSARLARSLRGLFEPILRQEVRTWAEPLSVQRFADYRAERPDTLTAWLPLAMEPGGGQALVVLDGRFVLELLDLFFGGSGVSPTELPAEFSPAADALIGRVGAMLAKPLAAAWEPVARTGFVPGRAELSPSLLADIEGEDAAVVTRIGIAPTTGRTMTIDILYPMTALKPHGAMLTGKVQRTAEPDPAWRGSLTRATMGVTFPVRSVLAEPTVPLSMLMDLKPGDVIPISIAAEVPVMIGRMTLGCGTVGTSNGRAAVRLTHLARSPEDNQ